MAPEGLVRVYCRHGLEIGATKISIFEYREPPSDELGYANLDTLFRQAFPTENLPTDAFYEAYRSGSKKPFYTSETPPANEELLFQLQESERGWSEKVAIWIRRLVAASVKSPTHLAFLNEYLY